MIEIGQYHSLVVQRLDDSGAWLDGDELGEILLPKRHLPDDLAPGESVRVFLYLDTAGHTVATTQHPKALPGQFAYLQAVDNTHVGTFLDWGLDKDLLVPFAEQHRPMSVDKHYLVYLYLDKLDGRIVASSRIERFLDDNRPHQYRVGQAVDLIIANSTDLGYKAIINHGHWGVLYENEVFERLSFGQSIRGYIKRVRTDGKIDLTLQGGQETRDRYAETILAQLRQSDGFLAVHDKSPPELISKLFGMSKKAYKKAIGGLYRQRLIRIEDDGIYLNDDSANGD